MTVRLYHQRLHVEVSLTHVFPYTGPLFGVRMHYLNFGFVGLLSFLFLKQMVEVFSL